MSEKLVGERVRKLRKQKGLTLKELAGLAGISIGFLGDIESGRTRPSIETLRKLAAALKTTTDFLLGNTNNPQFTVTDRPIAAHQEDGSDVDTEALNRLIERAVERVLERRRKQRGDKDGGSL